MSHTIKVNTALISSAVAILLALGTALIGYGHHSATIKANASGVKANSERIESLQSDVRVDLHRVEDKIDALTREVMELAKER